MTWQIFLICKCELQIFGFVGAEYLLRCIVSSQCRSLPGKMHAEVYLKSKESSISIQIVHLHTVCIHSADINLLKIFE